MNKWFIINYCHFMDTQSMIGMYKPLPKNHLTKKNVSLMIAWIVGVGLVSNAVITFIFVRSLFLAFFNLNLKLFSEVNDLFCLTQPYLVSSNVPTCSFKFPSETFLQFCKVFMPSEPRQCSWRCYFCGCGRRNGFCRIMGY